MQPQLLVARKLLHFKVLYQLLNFSHEIGAHDFSIIVQPLTSTSINEKSTIILP